MGEVKTLLKEARDAVGAKKYEEAQELCKSILRQDRKNYMALVLLGVSLQQSDKAPLAFHKAIEIDSAKPLAWQGLVTYYEKHTGDDAAEKLLSIYKKMLKLELEGNKVCEVIGKLGQLGLAGKTAQAIDTLAEYTLKANNDTLRQAADTQLLHLLKSELIASCSNKSVLTVMEKMLESYPADEKLALSYAKVMAENVEFPEFIKNVIGVQGFSNYKLLKEWLCKQIFKEYVSKGTLHNWDLKSEAEELTRDVDKTASSLIECISFFESGLYKEAYERGIKLVDSKCVDDVMAKFLIKCSMRLSNWSVTEKLICQILPNMKNVNTVTELKRSLLAAYVRQEKWKQGATVGLELRALGDLSSEDNNMLAQCLIHEKMNESDVLEDVINGLQTTEYYDCLVALRHILNSELEEAKNILEKSTSNTPIKWLYLGMVYWKLNEKDKCLMPLLKSTKLDPGQSLSFMYLGHYYREHAGDLEKAKKCYIKSVSLNCGNSEAARCLSKLYRQFGEDEANYELLQRVCNIHDQNEYWPKMQLGLYYLSKQNWDEAIKNLRSVIRVAPRDAVAWVSLADACYSRGSFTSALKCYTKVMELHPTETVYPETQIANINHLLGLYPEALTFYKNVLANDPKCVIALKGISSTLKSLAEQQMKEHCYGRSRESAQQAIEYMIRAINISPSFSCLWKMLGDTLMFITNYPLKFAYTHMPGHFLGEDSEESVYKLKEDIFPVAISCYARAIKISTFDSVPLYYDVSLAYWNFYKETSDLSLCHKALAAAEHCIRNKPNEWEYWNLLGVITMSDAIRRDDFARYCFLKALTFNKVSPEAWTNLGTLYLRRHDYRAANKAFKRAQEADPDYISSWVGQALIADAVKEDEAMDLYRHTTELGFHMEAAKGYAYWVSRTLQDSNNKQDPKYKYAIEKMHALPVALDLMTHVSTHEPRNACIATLLGLLQERFGLLRSANASYKISMEASTTQNERNISYLNLGRILFRAGMYADSMQILQNITEATFASATCTALALYRNDNYQESYDAFDTALHWLAANDEEKADLVTAMAGIIYKFKGHEAAKTTLFQSIKMCEKRPIYSLLALCALGLLHCDKGLSKLALNELKRYERDPEHGFEVAFLRSYMCMQEGEFRMSIKTMTNIGKTFPWYSELWYCFADLCLQESHTNPDVASISIMKAIRNNDGKVDLTRMFSTASIAEQLCGNSKSALRLAQIAIHTYPHEANNWAALILVLLPQYIGTERKVWLKSMISHVRRRLAPTRQLGHWLGLMERMVEKSGVS